MSKMSNKQKKEKARQLAMEWIEKSANMHLSWGEIAEITNLFYIIAKKYSLTEEFRENGII